MKPRIKLILKWLAIVVVLLLVVIQFFPIDKSTPEYDASGDFITMTNPDEEVKSILKTSCYDCHSFETAYPWYSNIAPISWWLKDHIDEGRDELNFSVWGTYEPGRKDHKLEEMVEEVEEHNMPLESYLIIHTEAKLSDEQIEKLESFVNELRAEIAPSLEEDN